MIIRILSLLLLSFSLTAQDSNWQHYFYANYIIDIIETNDDVWMATSNSIFRFNESEGDGELLHFNNAPFGRRILDVYQEDAETFWVLHGTNEMSRWHAGEWTNEVLDVLGGTILRRIVGKGKDGVYYLGDYYDIFSWDPEGNTATPVTAIADVGFTSTQGAEIDENSWLWFWRYDRLLVFNENLEVVIDKRYESDFVNDGAIDRSTNNVWLLRGTMMEIWLAEEQGWEHFNYEDIGLDRANRILWARDNEALVGNVNDLYRLTYSPDSGLTARQVFTPADDIFLHLYSARSDQQGKVWFFESNSGQLASWQEEQGFEFVAQNPWLNIPNIQSLGVDQQGKLWIGGQGQPAYMMGGRWHSLPATASNGFPLQAGALDMVFSPSGKPVIATGSLFVFGFSDSHLIAWDGMNWDTLVGAELGNPFLIIRHVEVDENNNLWLMRSEDQLLSVMSQGEWYHYKVNDMPLDADFFTCLEAGKDGKMWIGTNNGVVIFDGFNYMTYDSTALQMGEGVVRDIAIGEDGVVWLNLTDGGIRKQNGNNWELILAPEDIPIGGFIDRLIPDQKGGVWATISGYGIIHFDGQKWEEFTIGNSALMESYLHNIIVDKQDRLWCASYQGLAVYTPDRAAIEPYELPSEQKMAVFPNPGCCQFMVHWEAEEIGRYDFSLWNIQGQEVQTWSSNVGDKGEQYTSFQFDNLAQGVYFIQVLYRGEVLASQQLIVP